MATRGKLRMTASVPSGMSRKDFTHAWPSIWSRVGLTKVVWPLNPDPRRFLRIAPPMERGSGDAPATATVAGRSRRCRLKPRAAAAGEPMSLRPSPKLFEVRGSRLQCVLVHDQVGLPGDVLDAALDVIRAVDPDCSPPHPGACHGARPPRSPCPRLPAHPGGLPCPGDPATD